MSPTRWAATVADAPAIELDGLVRRYGERTALDGVSVAVPLGATLVVFGPNGAGKSTLLRVLATLLRPQGGAARVLGCELPREGWKVRGRVGLLGHEPLLHHDLTARENLRFHARLHGVAFERIDALLEQVGLPLRADEPVRELSRGVSGVAHRTLIVNFPGSPKAVGELFGVVAPTLRHVADTLGRDGGRRPGH